MGGSSVFVPRGPSLHDIVTAVIQRPVMLVKPTDKVRFTVTRVEWQRAIRGKEPVRVG